MTSKAFTASWIIQLVANILGGIGGLFMVVYPQVFMADEVRVYLGRTWSELEAANPDLFRYFLHDVRLLGFTQVALALVVIVVVLFYYRKRDKVAWFLTLLATAVYLVPAVTLNILIGEPGVTITLAILLVASIVALALGFQPVFGQSAGRPQRGPALQAS